MSWQPIESAPKDGTNVLLFEPDLHKLEKLWGWDTNRPSGMTSRIIVGCARGREDSLYWVSDIVEHENGYYGETYINPITIEPTHWMPLPEEPK